MLLTFEPQIRLAAFMGIFSLGHKAMEIGLRVLRDPAELRLDRLLTQPFRPATDSYSIQGE